MKILISSASIKNYCHGLKKGLETLTFFIFTNNYYCGRREKLEIQLMSTTSTSFVGSFEVLEIISFSIELITTG